MDISKYLKEESLITELAGAHDVRSARVIMMIVEKLRDEKRARNETKPRRNSENLTEDWVYIAGMIGAFNAILKLPKDAQDFIKKLPDTGEPK